MRPRKIPAAFLVAFALLILTYPVADSHGQAIPEGTYRFPRSTQGTTITGVVFTGERSFVVRACDKGFVVCRLVRFAFDADGIRVAATGELEKVARPVYAVRVHRAPHGNVLFDGKEFDGSDLRVLRVFPNLDSIASPDGALIASREGPEWCVARLEQPASCVASVADRVIALGESAIVVQEGRNVRLLDLNGHQIGNFRMPRDCTVAAAVLSTQQILVSGCGQGRIITPTGELKRALPYRLALDYDMAFADQTGTTVLLVIRRRTSSRLHQIGEAAVAIGTLGAGVADEQANEMLLRVIDTGTGKEIYRSVEPYRDSNTWPFADLSRDGRNLVIANGDCVSVYRLNVEGVER